MTTIAGIDFSMNSPAVTIGKVGDSFSDLSFYAFRQKKKQNSNDSQVTLFDYPTSYELDVDRFEQTTDIIIGVLEKNNVKTVYMEGYAYAASGNTYTIGEATGILKYKLWKKGIDLTIMQPSEIKKIATGKGNANKELMLEFFGQECCGFSIFTAIGEQDYSNGKIPSPITDIVDSYFIWKAGIKTHQLQIS